MSRFFRGGSDSESESESDNSYVSEQEDDEEIENEIVSQAEPRVNKWAHGVASESESDEESQGRRKALSRRDKRFEELENAIKAIENYCKISDWVAISNGKV